MPQGKGLADEDGEQDDEEEGRDEEGLPAPPVLIPAGREIGAEAGEGVPEAAGEDDVAVGLAPGGRFARGGVGAAEDRITHGIQPVRNGTGADTQVCPYVVGRGGRL